MNADAIRHLYDYHFAENRKLWDTCIMSLTQDQFTQPSRRRRGGTPDALHRGSVGRRADFQTRVEPRGFGSAKGFRPYAGANVAEPCGTFRSERPRRCRRSEADSVGGIHGRSSDRAMAAQVVIACYALLLRDVAERASSSAARPPQVPCPSRRARANRFAASTSARSS